MPSVLPPASSNAYADFIVPYSGDPETFVRRYPGAQIERINSQFAILYIPIEDFPDFTPENYSYSALPKCYTYMDENAAEVSGVLRLQNHPYLSLTGKHTLVAILDSGIDYANPAFRFPDGRSRIYRLWDQTLESGSSPEGFSYGTEFTQEQLNELLRNPDAGLLPPSPDENGHGTFLAGIAAGTPDPEAAFTGIAPDSELIIIKLKPAKEYLRDYYRIPADVTVYQENDLMAAAAYALRLSDVRELPLSVCCGLGTSQGAHIGTSPLSRMLSVSSTFPNAFFSVPAGNEGNTRHHYRGSFPGSNSFDRVELRVPDTPQDFIMELWGERSQDYWMDIESPSGEVRKIPVSTDSYRETFRFVFQSTRIEAISLRMDQQSGKPLILLRFLSPAPGIWTFTVYYSGLQSSGFDIWLPVVPVLSEETFFLNPSPDHTVTAPGDSTGALTATAYDYRNDSLYLNASRGFTPDGVPKPSLAAPGVQILGPAAGSGRFTERSGTSISAAYCAGIGALMFQWAVIQENAPYLNGISLKNYLLRSARRDRNISYPSKEWGYGILDLYQVFADL